MKEQIESLEEAIESAKKDPQANRFAQYGKRILELVKEQDYDEVRFTAKCFRDASCSFWRGPINKVMENYVNATVDLLNVLP
ncbi:hypothetical protein CMI37_11450 [Candidatus Pacearchaeota archaeon]|nr:hypothetical protein [Candidatus Pacearchaeota archaeon]